MATLTEGQQLELSANQGRIICRTRNGKSSVPSCSGSTQPNPIVHSRQEPVASHSDSESDDPGRGRVVKSIYKPEFKHNEIVYIRASGDSPREGPYRIERVLSGERKFILCDFIDPLITAKGGRAFEAQELEVEAKPGLSQ
ncbi:hypothetical protein F5Y03DRAFT_321763 [Xylaria venustula]|nr:hypothetical protein F5Y03DRAFT_321763 [Xylaria venustula]